MLTMWPLPWVTICRMARCVMWKNPVRFTAVMAAIVVRRVIGEGLADEDPGVVDQAVDPPEPIERLLDHASGGLDVCDVTLHGEEVGLVGRGSSARWPTTAYPARRNAAARPAPIPCEAPVMIATFCDSFMTNLHDGHATQTQQSSATSR